MARDCVYEGRFRIMVPENCSEALRREIGEINLEAVIRAALPGAARAVVEEECLYLSIVDGVDEEG